MDQRTGWRGKPGFVLATAGAAVGLGSLWPIPVRAAGEGAGAFVLVYLGSVVLVGMPVLLGELVLGRRSQSNAVGAFRRARKTPRTTWTLAGSLAAVTAFLLLSVASVVAGWSIEYARRSWAGEFEAPRRRVEELAGRELLERLERSGGYDPGRSLAERPRSAVETAQAAVRLAGWRIEVLSRVERAQGLQSRTSEARERFAALSGESGPLAALEGRRTAWLSSRDEAARGAYLRELEAFDALFRPLWADLTALWAASRPGAEEWEALEVEKRADLMAELRARLSDQEAFEEEELELARVHVARQGFRDLLGDARRSAFRHAAAMGVAILIVLLGVRRGIERTSKLLVPVSFLLLVALLARALSLEGRPEALAKLLEIDFAALELEGALEALGHALLALGLGLGAMITYGGYATREDNLNVSTAIAGTLAALSPLLAGAAISAFSAPLGPGAWDEPAGALFRTLPAAFADLPAGRLWGAAFYLLVGLGALGTMVALLEVLVSFATDEWRWPRWLAAPALGAAVAAFGLLSVRSLAQPFDVGALPGLTGTLDLFAFLGHLGAAVLLPLGGLLVSVFVGWGVESWEKKEEVHYGRISGLLYYLWDHAILKFVAPGAFALVILQRLGVVRPLLERLGF